MQRSLYAFVSVTREPPTIGMNTSNFVFMVFYLIIYRDVNPFGFAQNNHRIKCLVLDSLHKYKLRPVKPQVQQ